MPKCPRCKAEVDLLEETALQEIRGTFRAGYEREPDDGTYSPITGWQVVDQKFSCPGCHNVLFTNEDDADDFLSSEG